MFSDNEGIGFLDIFEEIKIESSKSSDSEYLKPFNEDYNDEMVAIRLNFDSYAFMFYLACEGNNAWGNCYSMHDIRPFYGISLFDDEKIYKRVINDNEEIIQIEQLYCSVVKVFKVKKDTKIKFRNEDDFQQLIIEFNKLMLCCYLQEDFEYPNCNFIKTDSEGFYIKSEIPEEDKVNFEIQIRRKHDLYYKQFENSDE